MESGHLSAAQIITYLVGALQLVLGLLLNSQRKDVADLRGEVNAERTRLNQTREEMLKRSEFSAEMTNLFQRLQDQASETNRAREAFLNELSTLRNNNATTLGRWEQLDKTLTALNATVTQNSARMDALSGRVDEAMRR